MSRESRPAYRVSSYQRRANADADAYGADLPSAPRRTRPPADPPAQAAGPAKPPRTFREAAGQWLIVACVAVTFGPILIGGALLMLDLALYALTGWSLFDALGWMGP